MTWISVKKAAALMGYSEDYFRRVFCAPDAPILVVREWRGPRGGRRVLVLRNSVELLLQAQVRKPA